MKLNNRFFNSHWVIEEIREEIEKNLQNQRRLETKHNRIFRIQHW